VANVQKLKTKFCDGLAMDLAYTLSENLVVMSTNIVASMLLIDRQGGVTEEELVDRSTWLFKEIQERKGYIAMNTNPS
jgi:glycerol-3-phosphate O-acyltransferase